MNGPIWAAPFWRALSRACPSSGVGAVHDGQRWRESRPRALSATCRVARTPLYVELDHKV